ncbi:MAG TPA: chromosome segregation protein SMC, partial [Steroidobacteraceae bacterium]|nr:chromosome segregation protein SMC [Steroidobacteraceae bacterium]
MRLTKIKLAGFKSFVDPTSVGFPSNLTGVVGPNGCGKSNIIDAVRWVMGELSAKHLRGDSMADVVFNGSGARKPVGTASVELMFDNGDGRIAGPYAAFNEVSLKRVVARDGSSNYFLNGTRCRRRDITQLFLGTGLGSRSYSIIEQGMISRVIEAKPEDMRAFIEEAAGISRYKERRRETEARVADTRENLERLQDVRDEVDKQIRHLQRQAATARRYQALKEKERRTAAELLALKLRDLDGGAGVHDAALRERELAMQAALADQRAAEASVTRRRTAQESVAQQLAQVQGRHYAIGADISHGEQALQHARELRERQRNDLEGAHRTHAELAAHITRDEQQLIELRAELERIAPELAGAQQLEQAAAAGLAAAEGDLADWQQRWEEWGRAAGAADQRTNVERARMEQLEEQLRGLTARAERLDTEREQLGAVDAGALDGFIAGEAAARARGEALAAALAAAAQQVQELRGALRAAEGALESARAERNRVHEQRVALEALQKAALGADAGSAGEWLRGSGLAGRTRVAERLEVAAGWERAVETALGDYLEAVCVEKLDELAAPLAAFSGGRVVLVEESVAAAGADAPESLASKLVKAPPVVSAQLSQVGTVQSLEQALALRGALAPGRSVITPAGEWVGPGWVRISRGQDRRAGIIEREQQLKALRAQCAACEEAVQGHEQGLGAARRAQQEADAGRDRLQSDIQAAHREHSDARSQLEGARARVQAAAARRDRLEAEIAQVRQETAAAQESLARARAGLAAGQEQLDALLQRRPALEGEREERRAAVAAARAGAQSAQATARDLLVRSESRRSTASSVAVAHERMVEQRAQLAKRRAELAAALEGGEGPIEELRQSLDELRGQRLTVEQELTAARGALEEAEAALRAVEVQRGSAEAR